MENLNLEKFSPTKAELALLAQDCKKLTINGIDDKDGYQKVNEARIKLKNTRVAIQKTGKILRADAVSFQRAVIEKEKELIGIIEPIETDLEKLQAEVDLQKEKAKRKELLPERKAKLAEISVQVEDDVLLEMDDDSFSKFYNQKHSDFLAEKERQMKAEAKRLEDERLAKEKAANAELETERAKVRADAEKVEAEKRKIQEQKDAEAREKKRQAEIEEAKIQGVKEAEAKAKQAEADRIKAEKEAAKKLQKDKEYQEFLKKNKYKTGGDFYILKEGNKIILFKKIDEFTAE